MTVASSGLVKGLPYPGSLREGFGGRDLRPNGFDGGVVKIGINRTMLKFMLHTVLDLVIAACRRFLRQKHVYCSVLLRGFGLGESVATVLL